MSKNKTTIAVGKEKPYPLHIIEEKDVEAFKAQGYDVRRLDPSVTGIWVFGDEGQAADWIHDNTIKPAPPNKRDDYDKYEQLD